MLFYLKLQYRITYLKLHNDNTVKESLYEKIINMHNKQGFKKRFNGFNCKAIISS
jgi:hypothetical protein